MAMLSHLGKEDQFKDLTEMIRISIENHDSKDKFQQALIEHPSYQSALARLEKDVQCLQRSHFDLISISERNMHSLLGAVESFLPNELLLNPTKKMEEVTRNISNVIANTLMAHSQDPSNKYFPILRNFAKAMIFEDAFQYPGEIKLDVINERIAKYNEAENNTENKIAKISIENLRDPAFSLSDQQTRFMVGVLVENLQSTTFNLMEHMSCHEIYGMVAMKNIPFVFLDKLTPATLSTMATHSDYKTVIDKISKNDKAKTSSIDQLYYQLQSNTDDPTVRRFVSDDMMYESELYLCEANKGRGKPDNVFTNTLGLIRGASPKMRQGMPTNNDYKWIDWTTCEFIKTSKIVASMVAHETPFISSYSGSTSLMMNLMLSSFTLPELSDRQAYIASVMAYIVGIGFHSQHEVLAPISYCLHLIPPEQYPVEVATLGESRAPQYHSSYQLLSACDPQFAERREQGWLKLMEWHEQVYQLHNKTDLQSMLTKLIENYPQTENKAISEKLIVNILQMDNLTLDSDTISLLMKNGNVGILNALSQHHPVKPSVDALRVAVESCNSAAVAVLLKAGADGSDAECLLSAVMSGNKDIAEMLLDNGADACAVDLQGFSCLALAYSNNDLPMISALLAKGAEVDSFNIEGNTLLHDVLASEALDVSILTLLIEKGADLTMRNEYGEGSTPLEIAIQHGHLEAIKPLLNSMKPLTQEERAQFIEEAQSKGHDNIVSLLVEKPVLSSVASIAKGLNIPAADLVRPEAPAEANTEPEERAGQANSVEGGSGLTGEPEPESKYKP